MDGGVDQGPWLRERVGLDGSSKEGGGLGRLFQRGQVQEGLACLAVPQEGARARGRIWHLRAGAVCLEFGGQGVQGLRFRGG